MYPEDVVFSRYSLSTSLLYFMLFLQTMEGHSNAVICLVVANRLMYTGGADGSARCWVTEFGDCTRHYKGHKHSVICMKFDKGVCMFSFISLFNAPLIKIENIVVNFLLCAYIYCTAIVFLKVFPSQVILLKNEE